jgi:hypothetical protein
VPGHPRHPRGVLGGVGERRKVFCPVAFNAVHGAEGSVPWGSAVELKQDSQLLLVAGHARARAHTHTHTLLHPVRARGLVLESTWFLAQAQLDMESAYMRT